MVVTMKHGGMVAEWLGADSEELRVMSKDQRRELSICLMSSSFMKRAKKGS